VSLKRLSLRQSLAMWTLVPMIAFSALVLLLSFGWAWRNIQEVAREHNVSLARVKAAAVETWLEEGGSTAQPPCELIRHLTLSSPRRWYLVDGEGTVCFAGDRSAWGDLRPGVDRVCRVCVLAEPHRAGIRDLLCSCPRCTVGDRP